MHYNILAMFIILFMYSLYSRKHSQKAEELGYIQNLRSLACFKFYHFSSLAIYDIKLLKLQYLYTYL